jgi:hypothetical protein
MNGLLSALEMEMMRSSGGVVEGWMELGAE